LITDIFAMKTFIGSLFILLLFLNNCTTQPELSPEEHLLEVEEWHENRVASLSGERGWLRLAGLFWLEEGTLSFGSDSTNDIAFPEGSIPEFAGTIQFENDFIILTPATGVEIFVDGTLITDAFEIEVSSSPEFTHGRLAWTFLSREELTGLRLYDQESHVYVNFKGIERYPVDLKWSVNATLRPHPGPTEIPVVNILGQTSYVPSPGVLEFSLGDENFRLIALEAANNRLFIIVGDETNRDTTFQGGRYMYIDNPGPNRSIVLDFNKAYNPPCAFSEYTTCQLPPPENRLAVRLEAGEKRYAQPVK